MKLNKQPRVKNLRFSYKSSKSLFTASLLRKRNFNHNLLKIILFFIPVLFSSLIVFLNLNIHLNTRVPYRDSSVFIYIANAILEGKVPYKEMWDHKPPLIYFINAVALFLSNRSLWGIWVTEFISLFLSSLVLFKLLEKQFGKLAGFVGVLIFNLQLGRLISGGNITEEYALLPQFLVLSVFLSDKRDKLKYFLIGIFSSLVFFLKVNNIGITISIFIYLLFSNLFYIKTLNYKKLKSVFISLLFLFLGFSILTIILFIYLQTKGILKDFWDQIVIYNFHYSRSTENPVINLVSYYWSNFGFASIPVTISYLILLLRQIRDSGKISLLSKLLIILFPIELFLAYIPAKNYSHYQIALILVSVLLLIEFTKIIRKILTQFSTFTNQPQSGIVKITIPLIALFIIFVPYLEDLHQLIKKNVQLEYRIVGRNLKPRLFRFNDFSDKSETINLISSYTNKEDSLLIWGSESFLYFVTGRYPPTEKFYQYSLFTKSYADEKLVSEFTNKIISDPPKLIIDASTSTADDNFPPSYIVEPIYPEDQSKWIKEKGDSYINQNLEPFFDYIYSNYDYIGNTYNNRWKVYLKNN